MKDKRLFQRLESIDFAGFKVRCAKSNETLSVDAEIVNLSLNGASLVADQPLGTPFDIQLTLPKQHGEKSMTVTADLMWMRFDNTEKKYIHGVSFPEVNSATRDFIAAVIQKELDELDKNQSLLIPKDRQNNYKMEVIKKRLSWIAHKTGTKLSHLQRFTVNPEGFKGNIENLIGVTNIPLGIAGPLLVHGQHARGEFYVPMATTEGALVMTYDLGMRILSKAGGVSTKILKDEIHISPAFLVGTMKKTDEFIAWINSNYKYIKQKAESTTRHGKLLRVEPITVSTKTLLRFVFFTGDAQGLNMINKAVKEACDYIQKETGYKYVQRANYSGIKKLNMDNIYNGLGKSVVAEATIPKSILRVLRVTPEEICQLYDLGALSSTYAGMIGRTAHIANGITAIFLACGQDVADISVSHIGFMSYEVLESGDLYMRLNVPNLLLGTVGGGTGLGSQKECLEILDCYGTGKAKKFAEIVTASALAGEIAVLAALINGSYVEAHEKYGRNKPANA